MGEKGVNMGSDYEQGKKDLAEQIFALLLKHKEEDWRDLMWLLEKHLTEGK